MKTLIQCIFCLFLMSCGSTDSDGPSQSFNLNQRLEDNRPLKGSEMTVAQNICDAYEAKRLNFPTQLQSKTLTYSLSETSCASSSVSTDITAQITAGPGFASSYSGAYFSTIQTDRSGDLKTICDALDGEQTPNTTYTQGVDEVIQFNFLEEDTNSARYVVVVGVKSGSSFYSSQVTEYQVRLTAVTSPSTRGLVLFAQDNALCPDGSAAEQSLLKQSFRSMN